jgi:hypothetical protein
MTPDEALKDLKGQLYSYSVQDECGTKIGKCAPFNRESVRALLAGYESTRPRVLTLREVQFYQECPVLWIERTGGVPAHWMDTNGIINYFAHPDSDYSTVYGVTWRCWTRKPAKGQSESMPWESSQAPVKSCDTCADNGKPSCPWEGSYHHKGEHGEKIGVCNAWKQSSPELVGANPIRPEIVCLCGPLRNMDAYRQAEYDLEMQGVIVLAPSFLPGASTHDGMTGCTPEEKIMLDQLHKRKIDLSDAVLVINVGGYIGTSTRSEIEYAESHGKPVHYWDGTEILIWSSQKPGREG